MNRIKNLCFAAVGTLALTLPQVASASFVGDTFTLAWDRNNDLIPLSAPDETLDTIDYDTDSDINPGEPGIGADAPLFTGEFIDFDPFGDDTPSILFNFTGLIAGNFLLDGFDGFLTDVSFTLLSGNATLQFWTADGTTNDATVTGQQAIFCNGAGGQSDCGFNFLFDTVDGFQARFDLTFSDTPPPPPPNVIPLPAGALLLLSGLGALGLARRRKLV